MSRVVSYLIAYVSCAIWNFVCEHFLFVLYLHFKKCNFSTLFLFHLYLSKVWEMFQLSEFFSTIFYSSAQHDFLQVQIFILHSFVHLFPCNVCLSSFPGFLILTTPIPGSFSLTFFPSNQQWGLKGVWVSNKTLSLICLLLLSPVWFFPHFVYTS